MEAAGQSARALRISSRCRVATPSGPRPRSHSPNWVWSAKRTAPRARLCPFSLWSRSASAWLTSPQQRLVTSCAAITSGVKPRVLSLRGSSAGSARKSGHSTSFLPIAATATCHHASCAPWLAPPQWWASSPSTCRVPLRRLPLSSVPSSFTKNAASVADRKDWGFRRFSLRGREKVSLEWNLVCLAYNVRRLEVDPVGWTG